MPSPVIDLLSGRARLALPFVEQGVAAGLSASSITSALSEAGLSFRRTDMLSLIRAVSNKALSRSYISSVPNNFLPNPSRFTPATTFTSRQYSYLVKLEGVNHISGEQTVQFITIATDEVITKAEALQRAQDAVEGRLDTYELIVDTATVQNAFVNPLFA